MIKDSIILWNIVKNIDSLLNKDISEGTLFTTEEINKMEALQKYFAKLAYKIQEREGF